MANAKTTPAAPVQPRATTATRCIIRSVSNGYIVAIDRGWEDDRETVHTTIEDAISAITSAMAPAPKLTGKLGTKRATTA